MKMTYFVQTDGGCDYYRALLPMETAKVYEAAQVEKVWPHNILMDIEYQPERFAKYMQSDIFLLPRIMTKSFIRRIQSTIKERANSGRVVLDYDDNVFHVSPMSPHYIDYGTQNVKININGELKDLWTDGVNIDLKRNQQRLDDVRWCMEHADMITTTTDVLAQVFREFNDNVRVLPNCVDLKLFERVERKKDTVDLFWAGGWSHYEDIYIVKDALIEVMKKYPQARLVFMGHKFDGLLKDIDQNRIVFHDWTATNAYAYKLSLISPDICFIPLADTEFNRCKSPIKWLEMGALKVPCVTSYIPPYAKMAEHDEDNGFYIEDNKTESWVDGLSKLIENADLRQSMGERAYQTVKQHYDINTQYNRWVNAYQEVLCQSPRPLLLAK